MRTILTLTLSDFLCDCDLAFDAFLHSMCTLCLDKDNTNSQFWKYKTDYWNILETPSLINLNMHKYSHKIAFKRFDFSEWSSLFVPTHLRRPHCAGRDRRGPAEPARSRWGIRWVPAVLAEPGWSWCWVWCGPAAGWRCSDLVHMWWPAGAATWHTTATVNAEPWWTGCWLKHQIMDASD